MKPDSSRMLEVFAEHLMARIAPVLPRPYQKSDAMTLGYLLLAVAEETERAASRRVEENAALRRLFESALPAVEDTGLTARLSEAAAGSDDDLKVSALEAANAELRALLIELHAHVEDLATPEAHSLEAAIWLELDRSTQRRRLSIALF